MDKEELELIDKLKDFKDACVKGKLIDAAKSADVLSVEDVYPGITPRTFIINVMVDDKLLGESYSDTLKKIIKLFYDNITEDDVLKSILTFRICSNSNILDTIEPS